MNEATPSVTAQRVAAYRSGFERLVTPFGDPAADDRLALDASGAGVAELDPVMSRFLQGRTSFFDRVVVRALDRNVPQVVLVGAGYDGRAWRYAKPGVRWFELDHPATQRDKLARLERLGIEAPHVTFVSADLGDGGLASRLVESGYEPDASSLVMCEGVAVYLDDAALASVLRELRAVATVGTRLAMSCSVALTRQDQTARRDRFQASAAAVGEPARNILEPEAANRLLTATRWRAVELPEWARQAGFVVAAPSWVVCTPPIPPPTLSRIGKFMEQTFHRAGTESLAPHLESHYGIRVARLRELDVGVFRVDRRHGTSWVARVFPASRPMEAALGDAEILRELEEAGYPAERCAHPDPVSSHEGQGVLVTEYVAGKTPAGSQKTFRMLGEMLGRLHTLAVPASSPLSAAGSRPSRELRQGGAWHHLTFDGGPSEEIRAAMSLLDDAKPRVPIGQGGMYSALWDELERADAFAELPEALLHPDFVPANVIASPNGDLTLVDWTGAGRGPRVASLGFLLWAARARSGPCADAVISGYRSFVDLEPDELDRLAAAISARPLVFGCWSFATGRERLSDVVDGLAPTRARAAAVADRARATLRTPADSETVR